MLQICMVPMSDHTNPHKNRSKLKSSQNVHIYLVKTELVLSGRFARKMFSLKPRGSTLSVCKVTTEQTTRLLEQYPFRQTRPERSCFNQSTTVDDLKPNVDICSHLESGACNKTIIPNTAPNLQQFNFKM